MTVKELIARLQEFDPDLDVFAHDDTIGTIWVEPKRVRHANLPEHELYVVLTTARVAPPTHPIHEQGGD